MQTISTLTEQRLARIWARYTQAGTNAAAFFDLNEYLWDVAQTLRDCGAAPWAVELFADAAALALSRAVWAKEMEVAA